MVEPPSDLSGEQMQAILFDPPDQREMFFEVSPESFDAVRMDGTANELSEMMIHVIMPDAIFRDGSVHLVSIRVQDGSLFHTGTHESDDRLFTSPFDDLDRNLLQPTRIEPDNGRFARPMPLLRPTTADVSRLVLPLPSDEGFVTLDDSRKRTRHVIQHSRPHQMKHPMGPTEADTRTSLDSLDRPMFEEGFDALLPFRPCCTNPPDQK